MASPKRVLVVRHPGDPFGKMAYVIHLLTEAWQQRGIEVEVTTDTRGTVEPDVLVFPHLDLTVTPPVYQSFFERCARVLNRGVKDISKRRISRNLLSEQIHFESERRLILGGRGLRLGVVR